MRIVPVTGDLPAIVVPPPLVPPAQERPGSSPPVVESVHRSRGAGSESAADHPPPRTLLPFFDPPLIAQRAALGLPVGSMIADFARTEGITYTAASAAVDAELGDGEPGDGEG